MFKKPGGNRIRVRLCLTLSISWYLRYLMRKFCDLDLGRLKVIQGQKSWYQLIAHGRLPVPLLLTPTSYLSPFLKYLTSNFDYIERGQFKVIQGQRPWCQLIAQGRFRIRFRLTPSWYLSPFSRYLTLKLFFHRMCQGYSRRGTVGQRYSASSVCSRVSR